MNFWRPIGLIIACALPLSPIAAQARTKSVSAAVRKDMAQPFLVVETAKGFATLQQAVDAIGDGRGTIRILSGTYHQCAVQRGGEISFVAAEAGRAIFEHILCEGRAALILRGRSARIDGAVFQHMRAQEQSGGGRPGDPNAGAAGASAIALEAGSLSIVNSLFRSSDAALVTADLPDATLHIRQASFTNLGRCMSAGPCASGVQIGHIANLRLFTSAFSASTGGALLSSRAVTVDVEGNRFEDHGQEPPRAAMLALPSGAVGRIRRSEFILHHGARDRAVSPLIAVAGQDRRNPSRGLVIDDNAASFAKGVTGSALFVANASGEAVAVGHNELSAGIAAYQRPGSGT